MKTHARYAVALVLMVNFFAFCAVAQPQTKPNKKTPSGQVSGSVTIRGKPAAGVVVAVRTNDSNSSSSPLLKAITDEDGKYHIGGIPPGTFLIALIASALVTSETGQYGQSGRTVVIAEDETVDEVDFTVVRGGVITGKVTDASGRPVIEEQVNLMPADQTNQRGITYPFWTDDRGIYRMYGIPAGRFKVSVGQGEDDLSGGRRGRAPYRRTFFPDATDPSKANVVEVAEGVEATNIDITVGQTVHGFSASGRVVDETGRPVTNMALDLSRTIIRGPDTSRSGGGTGVRSDRQGEFKIENLVPGKYSLSISPSPDSDLSADPVAFDVFDQDLTGLLIKASAGASISGVVVIEGSHDKSAVAKLAQSYLGAYVRDEGSNDSSGRHSQIKADGSFQVVGLSGGIANFSLGGSRVNSFAIVRVERDGAVQPNGIQIQNGEHLTGLRVVVAYGNATIRGVVKLENGTLPAGGRMYVRVTKPPDQFSNLQSPEVDSRGHFVMEGLVAGSYEVNVIAFVPGSQTRSVSGKQLVSVAEGSVTEVMLTIDLKQNPATTPGRP